MTVEIPSLRLMAPEGFVVAAALGLLGIDLTAARELPREKRGLLAAWIACAGCAAAGMLLAAPPPAGVDGSLFGVAGVRLIQGVILGFTVCAGFVSVRARFTRHVGEYFALLLLAAAGLMILVAADNLLMIFAALELPSLAGYLLTAFDKSKPASAEAALKYFLFGGVASAFLLFGFSLIYGVTGELDIMAVQADLFARPWPPVVYAAMVLSLGGLAFKVAAAPFHFWAPDVYEGAPAPVASFLAAASKVAGFIAFYWVAMAFFCGKSDAPVVVALAAASIIVGNLAALAQGSVRRLLAYSAVANAGYALLAVIAAPGTGLAALLFFILTYAGAALGAFAVVELVEADSGGSQLADFAGLSRRSPVLSFCMLVFVLSLAGVPPLSGFFGKFYLFAAVAAGAPGHKNLWLVGLALGGSAVSFYYYMQVLKQIYAGKSAAGRTSERPPFMAAAVVVTLAVALIAVGCAPDWLLTRLCAGFDLTHCWPGRLALNF